METGQFHVWEKLNPILLKTVVVMSQIHHVAYARHHETIVRNVDGKKLMNRQPPSIVVRHLRRIRNETKEIRNMIMALEKDLSPIKYKRIMTRINHALDRQEYLSGKLCYRHNCNIRQQHKLIKKIKELEFRVSN